MQKNRTESPLYQGDALADVEFGGDVHFGT
jgi:hypothetical protein